MALLSRESHKMENGLQYVLTTVSTHSKMSSFCMRRDNINFNLLITWVSCYQEAVDFLKTLHVVFATTQIVLPMQLY